MEASKYRTDRFWVNSAKIHFKNRWYKNDEVERLQTGLLTHNITQTALWNKHVGGPLYWLLKKLTASLLLWATALKTALDAQAKAHSLPLTKPYLLTREPNWLLVEQQRIITHQTLSYNVHYSQIWTNTERMTKLETRKLFTKCCQNCISSWTDRLSHQKQSMAHMHTPACNVAKKYTSPSQTKLCSQCKSYYANLTVVTLEFSLGSFNACFTKLHCIKDCIFLALSSLHANVTSTT